MNAKAPRNQLRTRSSIRVSSKVLLTFAKCELFEPPSGGLAPAVVRRGRAAAHGHAGGQRTSALAARIRKFFSKPITPLRSPQSVVAQRTREGPPRGAVGAGAGRRRRALPAGEAPREGPERVPRGHPRAAGSRDPRGPRPRQRLSSLVVDHPAKCGF